MKEKYFGSNSDRKYIATYLKNIRKLDPVEITTLPGAVSLADIGELSKLLDIEKFWQITSDVVEQIEKQYGIEIDLIQPERYYVGLPTEPNCIGGFHHQNSLGYQYWYQASFVVLLGNLISKDTRTIEMVRNYVHDCLHHSTFRSFRRTTKIPATSMPEAKSRVPEIYREQYGINFRNSNGLSYSAVSSTNRSPETINLNLLMDGVIVLLTASALKSLPVSINIENNLEMNICHEIYLEPFDSKLFKPAWDFHCTVTVPTQKFIEHWGGEKLIKILIKAMTSGNLGPSKAIFEELTGIQNAWEKLFKRPDFLQ